MTAPMNNTDISMPITLAQCNALLTGSDVSTDTPFDALVRLDLQLVLLDAALSCLSPENPP